jgi:serine phosphatase RsbU (regulator of sigma subunit)
MRSIHIVICLVLLSFQSFGQFKYPRSSDSLRSLIETTTDDTIKIRALTYLGLNYNNSKEESLPLYIKASRIAKEKKDSGFMAYSYGNIATVYYYSTQYDSALYFMEKVLDLRRKLSNQEAYISALNNLGILYRKSNNLPGALACFQERLSFERKEGNSLGIAEAYNNMANLYDQYGDREKALDLGRKSLAIRLKLKDSAGIASSYNNMATTFSNMKEHDSAVYYYEKSLGLADHVQSKSFYGNITNNLGHGYLEVGKDSLAEHYLKIALESRKAINYYFGIGQTQNNLAGMYYDQGKYDKALILLKSSLELSLKYGHSVIEKDASLYLSKVYFKLGQFEKAYLNLRRTKDLSDSLQASSQTREYAQKEYEYQYRQKIIADSLENEKEEALEAKQEELREYKNTQEKKRQKFRYWIAIAVGLSLAIISLILLRGNRQKARSNKLIQEQKNEIEVQKDVLQERNKEITDSINYAKRIQSAILPPIEAIKEKFPNSFVLYRPKDIVAGDFYWMDEADETVYLAAADCTGHGVPGAMVSVICNNGLNRSVREYGAKLPGEILDRTRELVIKEFDQGSDRVKDGMDIALCSLKGTILHYAGANNPLWIVRKGSREIEEYKGNKQPIGSFDGLEPFKTHKIELTPGDSVYLFSDGFADQFGGDKGKKMKNSNFKKLILSIQDKTMDEQLIELSKGFENWMADYEQLDDVCVIGVRV